MTARQGPKLTVQASCDDCVHCKSTRYVCQSDSGHNVRCEAAGRPIGDTTWRTPAWCPYLADAFRTLATTLEPSP